MPHVPGTDESEKALDAERKELRRARIQNGAESDQKNGPWPGQEPGEVKN